MTAANIAPPAVAQAPVQAEKSAAGPASLPGLFASLMDMIPSLQPKAAPQTASFTTAGIPQSASAAQQSLAGDALSAASCQPIVVPADGSNVLAWEQIQKLLADGEQGTASKTIVKDDKNSHEPDAQAKDAASTDDSDETDKQLALAMNMNLLPFLKVPKEITPTQVRDASASELPAQEPAEIKSPPYAALSTQIQMPETTPPAKDELKRGIKASAFEAKTPVIEEKAPVNSAQAPAFAVKASIFEAQASAAEAQASKPQAEEVPVLQESNLKIKVSSKAVPQGKRIAVQAMSPEEVPDTDFATDTYSLADNKAAGSLDLLQADGEKLPNYQAMQSVQTSPEVQAADSLKIAVERSPAIPRQTPGPAQPHNKDNPAAFAPAHTAMFSPFLGTIDLASAAHGQVATEHLKPEAFVNPPEPKAGSVPNANPAAVQAVTSDKALADGKDGLPGKDPQWAAPLVPHEAAKQYAEAAAESSSAASRKIFPSIDHDQKPTQEITTVPLNSPTASIDHSGISHENEANSLKPTSVASTVKTIVSAIPTPFRATTIEIRPEGLGRIQIRFSPQNSGDGTSWRVDIRTADPTAHALLTDNLGALRQGLKTHYVQVADLPAANTSVAEAAKQAKPDLGGGDTKHKFQEPERQRQREDRERKERFKLVDEEA